MSVGFAPADIFLNKLIIWEDSWLNGRITT